MKFIYSRNFQRSLIGNSYSAKVISDIVYRIVVPKSVVDVGCGIGVWLKAFSDLGVEKVLGIDGPWVDKGNLVIDKTFFSSHDLSMPNSIDVSSTRADLVISLEVAEHISHDKADDFVSLLTKISDVVLFSAAIPNQGGAHHINEQWQSYWRSKFASHGFVCFDLIRPIIWSNANIAAFYKQNVLLYVRKSEFSDSLCSLASNSAEMIDLVHPDAYLSAGSFSIRKFVTKVFRVFGLGSLIKSF
jgi:hypothetical protein